MANCMIFVLDTNVFSDTLKNIPFDPFAEMVYDPLVELINDGIVISVDEVYRELEGYFGSRADKFNWIKDIKKCFQYLDDQDCAYLMEILKKKKYQEGIKEKSIRIGSPEADAMIVAKALAVGGIVVTNESNKKANSDKIPNMCIEFNVPYIKKDDFYKVLKNKRDSQDLLKDVVVYSCLEID